MKWPTISVVVPVYQSSESLGPLVTRVHQALAGKYGFEVILVDDGSKKDTWETVVSLAEEWDQVKGVRLSRNFGQHNALIAGLRTAVMDVTVTIDDDLQNPPEEIPVLVDSLLDGDLDVVYGVPEATKQSVLRRVAGRVTRLSLRSGLGVKSATDMSSFRAFRTPLRDAFEGELGTGVSLDALLTWGGAKFGSVGVQHTSRAAGSSNYSFGKLLRFALDTTTGYSAAPLQVASILGLMTALFGAGVLVFVTARPIILGDSVPGFPFLAATIALFSGVQLFTLGIIGEYLARIHFRTMRKPTYVIRETTSQESGVCQCSSET